MKKYVDYKQSIDQTIINLVMETGMTPQEVAKKILTEKELWYPQTPEGEYLQTIANFGSKK